MSIFSESLKNMKYHKIYQVTTNKNSTVLSFEEHLCVSLYRR